jgi:hypothetical protein
MTKDIVPNFVQFKSDGLEFVVETTKGLAYATMSAAARMLGIDRKSVRDEVKGGGDYVETKAQVQTKGGIQRCSLISADVVFDLALKFNPELAKQMGKAGANLYMLGLAGYKIEVKERPIADPNAFAEHVYGIEELATPQVRWKVQDLVNRADENVLVESWYDPAGWYFLEFLNETRSRRICTIFVDANNTAGVARLNEMLEGLPSFGAKQVKPQDKRIP